MSTELITLPPEQYPALAGNVLAKIEEEIGEPISPLDLHVKHPQGTATKWMLPEGPVQQIAGIVLFTGRHNVRWGGTVGDGSPPLCKSSDGRVGIGDPGGLCVDCPFSKPGSHSDAAINPSAKRRRGCTHRRCVAALTAGHKLPMIFSAPPASLTPLRKWLFNLQEARIAYTHMVTRLGLEAKSKPAPHAVMTAEPVGLLDAAACRMIDEYAASFEPTMRLFLESVDEVLSEGNGEEV